MNTNLRILKALQKRNKTLSELSRELNLTKPSVYNHLSKLTAKGLIKRIHNGNKLSFNRKGEKASRNLVIGFRLTTTVLRTCISCINSTTAEANATANSRNWQNNCYRLLHSFYFGLHFDICDYIFHTITF